MITFSIVKLILKAYDIFDSPQHRKDGSLTWRVLHKQKDNDAMF